jgi:hypothetical protein
MECCLWYASPQRFFPVISAAKTRTPRQQLRHARTAGSCAVELPSPKHVSTIQCDARRTNPTTSIVRLCEHKSFIRHSFNVARGGCQLFLRRSEAKMGPWQCFNVRSANVQTCSLKAQDTSHHRIPPKQGNSRSVTCHAQTNDLKSGKFSLLLT